MFQPLVDGATAGTPVLVFAVKQMLIWGLKLRIGYLDVKIAFNEFSAALGGVPWEAVKIGAYAVAGAIGLIGVVIGLTVAAVVLGAGLIVGALFAIPIAVVAAGIAIGAGIKAAWDAIDFKAWYDAGANIVHGIIDGISATASKLVDKVKGLGRSALSAFGEAIDAHSPSRKFHVQGVNIGAGVEGGVEASTPRVRRAVSSMVGISETRAEVSAAGGAVGAGIAASVTPQVNARSLSTPGFIDAGSAPPAVSWRQAASEARGETYATPDAPPTPGGKPGAGSSFTIESLTITIEAKDGAQARDIVNDDLESRIVELLQSVAMRAGFSAPEASS
jgi:hypothetical protein